MNSQNNFEKQFCTYDISVALREIGFSEECLGCYDPEIGRLVLGDLEDYFNYNIPENLAYAPLYQQAIDWFREKHSLIVDITQSTFNEISCIIKTMTQTDDVDYYLIKNEFYIDTDSYEDAREQAILKAIELIKEK